MGFDVPEAEDTELNMTPMIDIVFQLIIFFMLQLKFKEIDRQIDSNLPDKRGIRASSAEPLDLQTIKIKLFRRNFDRGEAEQYTLLKVDNTHEVHLPTHWRGYGHESAERKAEYEIRLAELRAIVAAKRGAMPEPEAVRSEIDAPAPSAGFVPHGDVMRVLDTLLDLGLNDVMFKGQAEPLPGRVERTH